MSAERELLFGVLAVQLGFTTARDVMSAGAAWAADRSKGLAKRLENDGAIAPEKFRILHGLVEEAIKLHEGDSGKTLADFGGQEAIFRSFGGSVFISEDGEVKKRQDADGNEYEEDEDTLSVTPESPTRYSFGEKRKEKVSEKDSAEIGRGGIGRVLIAYDQHLNREIALKELLPEKLKDSKWGFFESPMEKVSAVVARFLREARVTGQLEHPNIVPVYELGNRKDGSFYYTMKLVRGRTLSEALEECKTLSDRLKLLGHFTDLCQAIAYAHSRGVVHRDVKPENVMVGEFGETVVLDWGLAKVRGKKDIRGNEIERGMNLLHDGKTADGQALGTPMYMSPEQADGRVIEIDERSDVWSLGVVLFQILTGEYPYEGATPFEIVANVLTKEPKRVRNVFPEAPPELASVVDKALNIIPEMRYQGAKDVADDVLAYQTSGRVRAYEYSFWDVAKRFASRNKSLIAVSSVFISILLVVAIGAYLQIVDERNRAVIAENTAKKSLATALAEKARTSRSVGETLVYAANALALEERADMRGLMLSLSIESQPTILWKSESVKEDLEPGASDEEAEENGRSSRHQVMSVAISNNGEIVASGGRDHTVRLWNAITGMEIRKLVGHRGWVRSVAFSPDDKYIASSGDDGTVRIWNTAEGKQIKKLQGHQGGSMSVTFSPDGKRVISGGSDSSSITSENTLIVWELLSGKVSARLKGHKREILSVAVSSDGNKLASGSADRSIRIWDLETSKEMRSFTGHQGKVHSVAFLTSDTKIVSGAADNTVRIWDLTTGKEQLRLSGHEDSVLSVSCSHDGNTVASGGKDRSIRLWDVKSGLELSSLSGHDKGVFSVAFSPKDTRLASGSVDETVRYWNLGTKTKGAELRGHEMGLTSVAFSTDGQMISTASMDKTILLWDQCSGQQTGLLSGHEGVVNTLAFSPDSKTLASGSQDMSIRIWNLRSNQQTETDIIRVHEGGVLSVAFSPDGLRLASGGEDGSIILWDTTTGKESSRIGAHDGGVYSIVFTPDGKNLFSAGGDRLIKSWNLETGKAASELTEHEDAVYSLALSDNGKLLASGSLDKTVRLWDPVEKSELMRFDFHDEWVSSVAFSPDSKILASGSGDGSIKLVDLDSKQEMASLRGHKSDVSCLAFSADGKKLASSSLDRTARIWDLESLYTPARALIGLARKKFGLEIEGVNVVSVENLPRGDVVVIKSQEFALYDKAVEGFKEVYHGDLRTHVMGGEGGLANPKKLAEAIRAQKPKAILAIGLRAAKAIKAEVSDIPIVFCMSYNPVQNKLITDNSTGVDLDPKPLDQLRAFKEIIPGLKKIGIIYDPKKTGRFVNKSIEVSQQARVTIVARKVSERKEVKGALDSLLGEVDALWLIRDPTVVTREFFYNTLLLVQFEEKLPILAFTQKFVMKGAVASFSADYENHGRKAAEIVLSILGGASPSDIPVQGPEGIITINLNSAEKSGVEFPKELLSRRDVVIVDP